MILMVDQQKLSVSSKAGAQHTSIQASGDETCCLISLATKRPIARFATSGLGTTKWAATRAANLALANERQAWRYEGHANSDVPLRMPTSISSNSLRSASMSMKSDGSAISLPSAVTNTSLSFTFLLETATRLGSNWS